MNLCLYERRLLKTFCVLYQVLRGLRQVLPSPPVVAAFMVDFEAAVWNAVRIEFPDATIKGCTFHFSQAIWRKVQDIGLQRAYCEKRQLHRIIR